MSNSIRVPVGGGRSIDGLSQFCFMYFTLFINIYKLPTTFSMSYELRYAAMFVHTLCHALVLLSATYMHSQITKLLGNKVPADVRPYI